MGPYGSVGAHIKTGRSPMAHDHFQTPPDPKKGQQRVLWPMGGSLPKSLTPTKSTCPYDKTIYIGGNTRRILLRPVLSVTPVGRAANHGKTPSPSAIFS